MKLPGEEKLLAELKAAGFTPGLPTPEQVNAHHEAHPFLRQPADGAHWIVLDPTTFKYGPQTPPLLVFVRLRVEEGKVMLWNGCSFTQSLSKTNWGERSWYRPTTALGLPVPFEDV